MVEGLAVRLAMEHAIALQLRKVIFETDSLQLVSAIVEQSNISDLHGILKFGVLMLYFFCYLQQTPNVILYII